MTYYPSIHSSYTRLYAFIMWSRVFILTMQMYILKKNRHVHLQICKKYVALIYLIIFNLYVYIYYIYIDALIDDIYIYHDISTFPAIRPVCHIASPMFRSSSRSCRALMERTWCFALSRPTCFPKKTPLEILGIFSTRIWGILHDITVDDIWWY